LRRKLRKKSNKKKGNQKSKWILTKESLISTTMRSVTTTTVSSTSWTRSASQWHTLLSLDMVSTKILMCTQLEKPPKKKSCSFTTKTTSNTSQTMSPVAKSIFLKRMAAQPQRSTLMLRIISKNKNNMALTGRLTVLDLTGSTPSANCPQVIYWLYSQRN